MHSPSLLPPQGRHVVFYSGGAVAGAFGGGLQEEAAHGDEPCPDVYVVNSAGLPNALARVAAEYEIIKLQEGRAHAITPEERAQIIHKHHAHLWDRIGRDFKHFLMPDTHLGQALTESMHAQRTAMGPSVLRLGQLQATTVALMGESGEAMRRLMDPFDFTGGMATMARTYVRDSHFWAIYLRSVFPEIDKALAHPGTPRVIAQAYNVATGENVQYDSRPPRGKPDGLNRLIGTMCIIGQVPLVDGVEADGGYTGFNGDNFEVMDQLIEEDPSYATARVTFVNLGPANLGSDAAMLGLNPDFLLNRAAAAQQKADVMRRHAYREFELDRSVDFKVSDKFTPSPRVIEKLRTKGRTAYWKNRAFSTPTEPPLAPAHVLHGGVPQGAGTSTLSQSSRPAA